MKVSYFGKSSKKVDDCSFMLGNKNGGYLLYNISSRYAGMFFYIDHKMYKVIDEIKVNQPIDKINNMVNRIEVFRNDVKETFFMPFSSNSMVYELNPAVEVELVLDVKESYDNREFGRIYSIEKHNDVVVIKFTKMTDVNEDESDKVQEYTLYLAIYGEGLESEVMDKWIKKELEFDKHRNSAPFNRHVYPALKLKGSKIAFSVSKNKDQAVREAEKVYYEKFEEKEPKDIALKCAENSLMNLVTEHGVMAGLPWFFQYWSRDELISLKALIILKKYDIVKKILLESLDNIDATGYLKDREISTIDSADSIGWLFVRTGDLLQKKRKYFNNNELTSISNKLEKTAIKLLAHHTKDDLAYNEAQETWMDSSYGEDTRRGARIELQALRLVMYRQLYKMTQNKMYKRMEIKMKQKVREEFFTGKLLKDGKGDSTQRPNIFIAAYVYPWLLSKKEWEKCFDYALKRLWLKWGGLTTIDKKNILFFKNHSGENAYSYHRGDSWYWLNNLAAIVLARVNKRKYKKYIDAIVKASTNDLLYGGVIGCCSELSSSSEQRSEGCLNQAWSNALFIEMTDEIK